jgi:hypothetical protein
MKSSEPGELNKTRKPYTAPLLQIVEIRPEESLLACSKVDFDPCAFIDPPMCMS